MAKTAEERLAEVQERKKTAEKRLAQLREQEKDLLKSWVLEEKFQWELRLKRIVLHIKFGMKSQ